MPVKTATRRLVDALASIRLAVTLMAALGGVCIVATFYESRHGTPAAQRVFYATWWFALLLALLAANVLLSMLRRLPWKQHHVGFVLAHVGILLILGGSLVSLLWGMDSSLAVYEGETTSRVTFAGQALRVSIDAGAPSDVRANLAEQRPRPDRELRFAIPRSDAHLVAEDYYSHANVSEALEEGSRGGPAVRRSVSPAPPPDREERRTPAVKARIEGPSWRSASEWLVWGDAIRLETPAGWATVSYGSPERSLPFHVTLLRFNSDKYPGSNMAATYESFVRVEDPERGVSEHHIAMNRPLHYRGYVFFQASFVEGAPMMSVLSVTRAPGLPAVYTGTALLCVGVLWMFYGKPYLLRRQGRAALRARSVTVAASA